MQLIHMLKTDVILVPCDINPGAFRAARIAESDHYVASGARILELYEWEMKVAPNQ
jgi:hypothetical protein